MLRNLSILVAAGLVALAAGAAYAQQNAADSTARGGIKGVVEQLDAEAAARAQSDDALQGDIDAEAFARAQADEALQSNIEAESLARALGDQPIFLRTVVVSPVGPTEADNCQELHYALADISNAMPPPGASNPYLIYLEPGVYDCGNVPVQMLSYVDIQGGGQNTTLITGTVDNATQGVVAVTGNSELRFLRVENNGGGTDAIAISVGGTDARVSHVTALAEGATNNTGIYVFGRSATPALYITDVIAEARGGSIASGMTVFDDGALLEDVRASAGAAATNIGMLVTCFPVRPTPSPGHPILPVILSVRNSDFIGAPAVQGSTASDGTANCTSRFKIAASELNGSRGSVGNFTCFAAYDGSFNGLNSQCN